MRGEGQGEGTSSSSTDKSGPSNSGNADHQPSTLDHQPALRDELVLYVPAAVTLFFVSSQTGFNHQLRYILPCVPALYIWLGRLAVARAASLSVAPSPCPRVPLSPTPPCQPPRWQRTSVALCLTWFIASSLWFAPEHLSYFNELVGGPDGGRFHLIDSNIDWGQNLPALKRWYDAHPEARPFHLAYFGMMDPSVLGIEYTLPPKGPTAPGDFLRDDPSSFGPQPGWHAVSVSPLMGHFFSLPDGKGGMDYMGEQYFTYFQRFRPVAKAGHSIFIYHVTHDEANRVRNELGMKPLP